MHPHGRNCVLHHEHVGILELSEEAPVSEVRIHREHERGVPLTDAALAGARLRLRPILMTAFAFILGVVPLVIATGSGAVSRQILGTTVLGGMLAATAIAIFVIPATFYVSQRLASRAGTPAPRPGSDPARPPGGPVPQGVPD